MASRLATCSGGARSRVRLVGIIEEGEQLVVLALGNRVVLVVVAARASDRQAQKDRAGRADPVDYRFDPELLVVDAAFLVERRIAVEAGGDLLLHRGVGNMSPAICSMTN